MSETRRIPPGTVLMLVGPSASGKSTWAHRHFEPHEIASSDLCRLRVCDSMESQKFNRSAFRLFHAIIEERAKNGVTVVADATHLKKFARDKVVEIAESQGRPVIAVCFDSDLERALAWNEARDRKVPERVIRKHHTQMESARYMIEGAERDRYADVWIEEGEEKTRRVVRIEEPQVFDDVPGIDVIGDIHGCADEAALLLYNLGYRGGFSDGFWHPENRVPVFVGDIMDRGPKNVDAMLLVYRTCLTQRGLAVQGNHCNKWHRYQKGNPVTPGPGLQDTIEQMKARPGIDFDALGEFFRNLPFYLQLHLPDEPPLVVAHAGLKRHHVGRPQLGVKQMALYGDVHGFDDSGRPIRSDKWAEEWTPGDDEPFLVYGHTVHDEPYHMQNTMCIDTGCFSGGKLTAFRWPERECVSVPAQKKYWGDQ